LTEYERTSIRSSITKGELNINYGSIEWGLWYILKITRRRIRLFYAVSHSGLPYKIYKGESVVKFYSSYGEEL
jgi:hypothetical protein